MRRRIIIHLLPLAARPVACLLGVHSWRGHPGSPEWQYCQRCSAERTA
jgi:hypothetical protein